jgi:DNA polymerase-1
VNRLLIVDGHAYAYRAFHAIRELRSPSGQPTNAIYGFVKMLEKMRQAVGPSHLMVVWDGGLSAERLAVLPDYKAQRPEMPADLRPQLDAISRYLQAAGVAEYCGEGVEADDYIASLARRAAAAGWNVVIASSDKDFMQLVSPAIGLLNPNDKTGAVWTAEQVTAKTGVPPEQVADWLALMGDAVDNIPGVPGVGRKTAAALLSAFASLEELYEGLDRVGALPIRGAAGLAAKLALHREAAYLARRLTVIACDMPLEFTLETLRRRKPDLAGLGDFYDRQRFGAALRRQAERLAAH